MAHRLDRETSGLLVAGKRAGVRVEILNKIYAAEVFGDFPEHLSADGFLVPDPESLVHKKRKFLFGSAERGIVGERAVTSFSLIRRCPSGRSLVRAELGTGRMHQIRATLYSLGFPVVGDKLYGRDETCFLELRGGLEDSEAIRRTGAAHQHLHAMELTIRVNHGPARSYQAPLPW
ncbi:MAG: RNA pseudouridine synthase, partial [Victivallaceae bacterium]|nr:RNA pseudouridine synthase [Victivallaceae bacterium]